MQDATALDTTAEAASARVGVGQWWALGLLTLIFAINSIDRGTVTVVLEPLKHEYHLTDSQLGLLSGLAFGTSYALFALPLGRLSDITNRRNVLAGLLAVWSLGTAACGFARNFMMLIAARAVVGGAESGGSPASNSMISDLFPPHRRATAVAIFFIGSPLGSTISFLFGSAVAVAFGWRRTFLLAAAPGLVLAVLLPLIMRHPARGSHDAVAPDAGAGGGRSMLRDLGVLLSNPVTVCLYAAIMISTMVSTSILGWFMSMLIREHHLALRTAGAAMALCSGVFGGIGVGVSGRVADIIARGQRRRLLLFMTVTNIITLVVGMVAVSAPTTWLALAGLAAYSFINIAHLGPSFAALMNGTPNRARGLLIAVLQICANFIGSGFGPFLTGRLSDAYGGPHSLSHALMTMTPLLVITIVLSFVAAQHAGRQDALSLAAA